MDRNSRFTIRISYVGLAIVFFYCFDLWHLLIMQILPSSVAKKIATVLLWTIYVIAISKNRKLLKKDALIMLILNFLLFIMSYIVHPEYGYAMFEMPTWNIYSSVFTFSSGLFAYVFFRMENDPVKLRRYLKVAAYLTFLWGVLRVRSAIVNGGFTRIFENGTASSGSYDMSVGYRFLFVCIVFLVEFLQEKRKSRKLFDIFMCVISAILMTVFGSRTAVVSLLAFWCLYSLLYQYEGNNIRNLVKRIAVVVGLAMLFMIFTNLTFLQMISGVLQKFGLGSRMLDSLLSGAIELDSGRSRLWTMVYEMIEQHPVFGAGIYADRAQGGIYCHQLLLELFLDFGLIVGTIFVLLILNNVIHMLFRCSNKEWKLLFIMFFSMCFIRLNVSSSFWYDTNFWVCIALVKNYRNSVRYGAEEIRYATR